MTVSSRKRAGLMEMATVVSDEASRIRITQGALIKMGVNKDPVETEIRRAEVFEDIAALIFAIQPVKEAVWRILAPVMSAMRTAENFPKQEPAPIAPAPDDEPNNQED